eukprot:5502327-Amphidinium_carterae.1
MQQLGKVQPLSTEFFRNVQQETLLLPEPQPFEYGQVAKSIIRLREYFADAVFILDPHEEPKYFLFVLATQKPFKLLLRPLDRIREPT